MAPAGGDGAGAAGAREEERQQWLPMSVEQGEAGGGAEGGGGVAVSLSAMFAKVCGASWGRQRVLGLVSMFGILLTSLLVLTAFVFVLAPPNDGEKDTSAMDPETGRPVHIAALLTERAEAAKADGALSSLVLEQSTQFSDRGIDFIVSRSDEDASREKDESSTVVVDPTVDPFAQENLVPELVVGPVPPQHTLLLNKFNTLREHALLVTNDARKQSEALQYSDFDAFHWCVHNIGALGFYNSAEAAGASQAHLHMQLIPLSVFHELRDDQKHALPIDTVIYEIIGEQDSDLRIDPTGRLADEDFDPFGDHITLTVPQYESFNHAVAVLYTEEEWAQVAEQHLRSSSTSENSGTEAKQVSAARYGEYLTTVYNFLLGKTGINSAYPQSATGKPPGTLKPYNLLLTNRWMMVVERAQRKFENSVDVNALGFAGALLARTDESLARIESSGPIGVLKGVSAPAKST